MQCKEKSQKLINSLEKKVEKYCIQDDAKYCRYINNFLKRKGANTLRQNLKQTSKVPFSV